MFLLGDYYIFDSLNFSQAMQTKNFPTEQMQVVRMPNVSDTNWLLAEPHIERIRDYLSNNSESKDIYISLTYSFQRPVT